MTERFLHKEFKSDPPVLPDVEILDVWGVWDGPLFGVCEVHNQKFFFLDLVESIWRFYSQEDYERRWRIYGVFDLPIAACEKHIDKTPNRCDWQPAIEEDSNCIGIFW